MSEYVNINGSVGDIISAANQLTLLGSELDVDMASLVGQVTSLEGHGTWGGDKFATEFLKKYHQPVDGGGSAAEAVKTAGYGKDGVGTSGQNLGSGVVNTMLGYSDTDTSSATDINNSAA